MTSRTILLVDDDEDLRSTLVEQLSLYDSEGNCLGTISLMTDSASKVVEIERLPDEVARGQDVCEVVPAGPSPSANGDPK